VAFIGAVGGSRSIYLMRLAEFESTMLRGGGRREHLVIEVRINGELVWFDKLGASGQFADAWCRPA
jgi:hypothetical protein